MRRSIVLGLLLGAGAWSITIAAQQGSPAPLPELTLHGSCVGPTLVDV